MTKILGYISIVSFLVISVSTRVFTLPSEATKYTSDIGQFITSTSILVWFIAVASLTVLAIQHK